MDKFNITPNLDKFLKAVKRYSLIPLSLDLGGDFITPIQLCQKVKDKKYSFLLESVEGEEKISRFSFVGFNPLFLLSSKGRNVEITDFIKSKVDKFSSPLSPLDELRFLMKRFKAYPVKGTRFSGGFVGYLGYDNVRFFEPVLNFQDRIEDSESRFVFCKYFFIFDHKEKKVKAVSFVSLPSRVKIEEASSLYREEKKNLLNLIDYFSKSKALNPLNFLRRKVKVKSNFSKKEFSSLVKRAKEHIKKGDIIQVVPSQRFSTGYKKDPFLIYRYLRVLNPSPYMYYLNFADKQVIGASPEMLLRCEGDTVITRPIAGTRRRGRDEREDIALEKELLSDPKEKAEHIMLVDLGRNDIGRVSEGGKVNISSFMKVERFSHVMHIVSEVKGKLDKGMNSFSALKACFPAGTVTGAPKIRAMQIIDELERSPRGIYAGCAGYFSFNGNIDTAIVIRTIVVEKNKAYVQAGGGIVLDSKPEKEYIETVNKAKAQLVAIEYALGM